MGSNLGLLLLLLLLLLNVPISGLLSCFGFTQTLAFLEGFSATNPRTLLFLQRIPPAKTPQLFTFVAFTVCCQTLWAASDSQAGAQGWLPSLTPLEGLDQLPERRRAHTPEEGSERQEGGAQRFFHFLTY